MSLDYISELEKFAQIERLSDEYAEFWGARPSMVSHWNSSSGFLQDLKPALVLPSPAEAFNYIYSAKLENLLELLHAFGFDPARKSALVTPSGTISIRCVTNFLNNLKKLVSFICPTYFSALYSTRSNGKLYCEFDGERFSLPRSLPVRKGDVYWVTNPIFCSASYLNEKEGELLYEAMEQGAWVVADECFSVPGKELARKIGNHENFIGIYSPHKCISINAIKFSLIVFDKAHEKFFEQWNDVVAGCLSVCNLVAIDHFLSGNYAVYSARFFEKIRGIDASLRKMLPPRIIMERNENSALVTCLAPHITAEDGEKEAFQRAVLEHTAGIFIPGTRNHFDPKLGLTFRLNLARDEPQFRATVLRIFGYLDSLA